MLVVQAGNLRKQSRRTGDGSKRVADFMGDGGGETSDSRQPVLHSHFALQAAYPGQIVESVNKSQWAAAQYPQFGSNHAKGFAEIIGSNEPDFAMGMLGAGVRKRIFKQRRNGLPQQLDFRTLQAVFPRLCSPK